MIIIDCETSGLDPKQHALLSIGAVDFDTGDEFYAECYAENESQLDPVALGINGFTKEQALDSNKLSRAAAYHLFLAWCEGRQPLLAGQQVGSLDVPFLRAAHSVLKDVLWPFGYRSVDLHSVAFVRFGKSLSLDGILTTLGLSPEPKPHNALNGARLERDAFKLLLPSQSS